MAVYRFASWRKALRADDVGQETLSDIEHPGPAGSAAQSQPAPQQLNVAITKKFDAALHERDLGRLVRAITSVVPDYVPSARLQQQISSKESLHES